METVPSRFIDEPVDVFFDHPPLLEKKPDCPSAFAWRGQTWRIVTLLSEWQDFRRRGRMARNMCPEHAAAAQVRGSWGVGRYFFRIQVEGGRIFDLYYDRAPVDAGDRKGHWFLHCERSERSLSPDS